MALGVCPGGSVAKNPCANAGDPGSILGWERSPGEGMGNPWIEEPDGLQFMRSKKSWT